MNGIADFLNFTKDVGQNFYQNVLADPSTYSFEKNPDEFNLRNVTDIIFDPDDPIDKASLALLLFPPAFGAAKIGQTLRKGGKLTSALKSGIADPKLSQRAGAFIGYPFLADEASAMTRGVDLRGDEYSGILSKDTLDTISQLGKEYMDDPELVNAILAAELSGKDFTEYLSDNKKEMLGLKNGGIASFKTGTGVKGAVKSLDDILKKVEEAKKAKAKKTDPKKTDSEKTDKPKEKKPTSTDKSNESLEQSRKAKKEKGPDKPRVKDKDLEQSQVGPPKSGSSVQQGSANVKPGSGQTVETGNVFTRAGQFFKNRPVTSLGGAAFIGSQLIPFFAGDGTDNQQKEGVVDSSANINNLDGNTDDLKIKVGISGNIDDKDYDPTLDRNLGDYINQNLASKGVTDPSFFDYIKALPSAYMKKVGDDPSFAKKMMAGFLNMMKPQEGIVPISAPVAFGEGYLGEETRQADMLPADVRTLKFLQQNPDLKKYYTEMSAARSGLQLSDVDPENLQGYYDFVVKSKARAQGIASDDIANYQLVYNGAPISDEFFSQLLQQNPAILADPNFALQLKSSGG